MRQTRDWRLEAGDCRHEAGCAGQTDFADQPDVAVAIYPAMLNLKYIFYYKLL